MISAQPYEYGEEVWGQAVGIQRKDASSIMLNKDGGWRQQAGWPGRALKKCRKSDFNSGSPLYCSHYVLQISSRRNPGPPNSGPPTANQLWRGEEHGQHPNQIANDKTVRNTHTRPKSQGYSHAIAKAQNPTTEHTSVRITARVAVDATTAELERAGSASMIFLLPSHHCYC